jgi:two-component system, LuxR family, sensor histidine kinase DctS
VALWRSRRLWLWLALTALVLTMLGILVFLAARYEVGQWQQRAERDAQHAVQDLRGALTKRVQSLLGTHSLAQEPGAWEAPARQQLLQFRDLMVLEWRDADLQPLVRVGSPYQGTEVMAARRSTPAQVGAAELAAACALAKRQGGPAYSNTYFWPLPGSQGQEVVELCLPISQGGRTSGFLVAVIGLQPLLSEACGELYRGRRHPLGIGWRATAGQHALCGHSTVGCAGLDLGAAPRIRPQ